MIGSEPFEPGNFGAVSDAEELARMPLRRSHLQKITRADFLVRLAAAIASFPLFRHVLKHGLATHPDREAFQPSSRYVTTWLGNTLGSEDIPGRNNAHVQKSISHFVVGDDGTVAPTALYSEAGIQAQFIKHGALTGKDPSLQNFGLRGGCAVAANAKYLYYAQYLDDITKSVPGDAYHVGIKRYHNGGSYAGAAFTGGMPHGDAGETSFLSVATLSWVSVPDGSLSGLAASATRLYASDPYADVVHYYDAETMVKLGDFAVADPGHLAIAGDGTLWIVSGTRILHVAADGAPLSGTITDIGHPQALAFQGSERLLVADSGARQQILIYDVGMEPPRLAATVGEYGGTLAGPTPGLMGPLRFYEPNAVGTDGAGNLYVNNGGSGTDLRCFAPDGAGGWVLRWRVIGTVFLDVAVGEPGTDLPVMYTKSDAWDMDWTKSRGREASSRAHTIDRLKNPRDPRLREDIFPKLAVWGFRVIGGKKFLVLTDQNGGTFQLYRMDGEIARPSVIFTGNRKANWSGYQPASSGRSLWRDLNGNGDQDAGEFSTDGLSDEYAVGWDIDANGDIWHFVEEWDGDRVVNGIPGGIERFVFQGIDSRGNPRYDYTPATGLVRYARPPEFLVVTKGRYIAETDTMYLGGYTHERPGRNPTHHDVGLREAFRTTLGTELMRFNNWMEKAGPRRLAWRVPLPYRHAGQPMDSTVIHTFDVVGELVFCGHLTGVVQDGVVTSAKPGQTGATETVLVLRAGDGARHGVLGPGPAAGGNASWIDMDYGVRAHRRSSNGEYVVCVEDVSHGKVIIYRGLMQST